MIARLLAALILLCTATAHAQQPGRRVALVVGNGAYKSVERLANPANDARLIASTLKASGFTLIGDGPQLDLDKAHFDRAVQAFGRALPGAEVALFYYSGHGMQVSGTNWLVPVDANPTGARDLDFQAVDAGLVLRQMEDAGTKLNMLVLDACRNNPFAFRGTRGGTGGLAEMRAPEGTMVSYATQPGNVAADGAAGNSPYTAALAAAMRRPGLDVFQVFNQVGLSVKQVTAGQQQPWLASSPISGNFYFFSGPVTIAPPQDADAVFWQSVASSRDSADFQAYLRRFPTGTFADLARRRMEALNTLPATLPASPGRRGRFDGTWSMTLICPATADGARGVTFRFPVEVRNGVLRGSHGAEGQPGWLMYDGVVQPDGTALIAAKGVTGDTVYTVGRLPPGTPYSYQVDARFEDTRGSGTRLMGRTCTAGFVKQ